MAQTFTSFTPVEEAQAAPPAKFTSFTPLEASVAPTKVASFSPIVPAPEPQEFLGSPMGDDFSSAIMAASAQPKPAKKVYTGSVFDTQPFNPEVNPEEAIRLSRRAYAEQAAKPVRRLQEMRPTPQNQLERTTGQTAADVALGLAQGANAIPQSLAANLGADNPVAEYFKSASEAGQRAKSPYLQSQQAQREGLLQAVGQNQGELAQSRATFTSLFSPAGADIVAQGAGSMLPTVGMSVLGLGGKALTATNALSVGGEAAQNTAEALKKMSPEDWSKSQVYLNLRDSGLSHQDSVKTLAPLYALPTQVLGYIIGAASGSTGLEKGLAGKGITGGALGRAKRAGAEFLGEEVETLAPGLAQNITQNLLDDKTSLMSGLGRSAVETAFGSLPGTALAAAGRAAPTTPQKTQSAEQMARERGFLISEPKAKPPVAPIAPTGERIEPTFEPEKFEAQPPVTDKRQALKDALADKIRALAGPSAEETNAPTQEGAKDVTEPISQAGGEGVAIPPQPADNVPPAAGVGEVERDGVVPTGQDVAKPAVGEGTQPAAVTTWNTMQPGQQVTLYRGENKENVAGGQWWTTDPVKAAKFGTVTDITLPSEVIAKNSAQGHNGITEFVFPTEGKRPLDLFIAQSKQPAAVEGKAEQTQFPGRITVEVPIDQLQLSEDVPQFKTDANKEGVVEPLGGKFERTGVAPIQVWRRKDGRMEIISGRHRFDLAKRSGEKTIPAQIHDEDAGFTKDMAAVLDAELNIRDGQGKVKDYVNYFKGTGLDQDTANSRGLLARSTGKRAFTISNQGSDELIAGVRSDKVGDEAAYLIALNAPNDSRLQSVGIKAIQEGKSAAAAVNLMQAVKALAQESDTTTDMFGFDESAMKEAEEMAKIAASKQREMQTRLSAITGAAKNPALAKAEGIDIRDPEAIKRRIDELRQLKASWDNWSTNPDLIAEIRAARGTPIPKAEPINLESPTEQDVADQEDRKAKAEKLDEQEQIRKESEAGADQFKLTQEEGRQDTTGSLFDQPADQAAARGQTSFLDISTGPVVNEEKKKRNPSLKRKLDKLNRDREDGKITDEAFIEGVDGALEDADNARMYAQRSPRTRGADFIRQRLLEAKRRGDLSEEAVDFAEWFIQRNPQLVDDLGVSIRASKQDGVSGQYFDVGRLMVLMKKSGKDTTTVHEILHHLERMMPPDMQNAIRKAWSKEFGKATQRTTNKAQKDFFKLLGKYHWHGKGREVDFETAVQMVKDGQVPSEFYQYVNPSEFWAVNGTDIMKGRFDAVRGGVLARMKNWLKELVQKIKSMVGMGSTGDLIKALDSLSKGDGKFQSKEMLGESSTYASVGEPNEPTPEEKEKSTWILGRDRLGRVGFGPGAIAYRTIADIANKVLDKLAMKPISPELSRAMKNMKAKVELAKNKVAEVASEMNTLSPEEREMISDVIEGELKAGVHPPQHILNIAAAIQSMMSRQSKELVDLGMLSKEAANRWDNKYLPRFYERQLKDSVNAWSKAAREVFMKQPLMRGIRGSNLRSRGLYEVVAVDDLPNWLSEGWEQRDPKFDPKKSVDTVVWRDYTREERDNMGEIRDAMFRFVMGYNASQRDIALGRLYKDLAKNYASPHPMDGYVHVPTGNAEGTGAARYGALEGMYVPKEIMDHLSANDHAMAEGILKIYRAGLSRWKEGKTVLNPVAHANNVLNNLTMAHFAGVSYWDSHKYAGAIKDLAKNDSEMVKEAKEVGLFGSTFSQAELIKSMPPELRAMANLTESALSRFGERIWDTLAFTVEVGGKKYGARPVMQWAYENEDLFFRYLIYRDARNRGMEPEDARDYSQEFIFTYDDLPKGARFLRDLALPFFGYTYKIVPVLARTALQYPWRFAAPATVAYTANAMMYAIAANLGGDDDDWLGKVLYKYITDEEFRKKAKDLEANERRNLPEWMKGSSQILQTPKAIRMGMDEVTKLPLFLDISRIFPGADLLDANNNAGGVAMIQPLVVGNPIITTVLAMTGNKDLFFGKDVTKKTDTDAEKDEKRGEWLWNQFTPAIAVGNYHFDRAMSTIANMTGKPITVDAGPLGVIDYTGVGKDKLPVQPKYSMLQTMGIKIRPYDLEMGEVFDKNKKRALIRDLNFEIKKINRQEAENIKSPEAAEIERQKLKEKKSNIKQGLTLSGEEKK